ncbi:MAG TPA: RNA polymerase sigma factor RpoH [Denitromonas sp.]|uniref:RNA polymerase sigma factor RpoH n=1 Tax=Denitromonas sp. TaxID=2734609 RepID=UPI001DD2CE24|nr:RNA polymerase sigma factor RpoH [Rhodocyclaceae bacterium]MCP5221579.1 RNA polymerase sigma factor RpoH [Zoogloeaceae bacterium]HQU90001.1 RNA polymerase sigma factor RpoH [Denitromonas sp.]HQV16138.1 RNA polymerase sigma factor RpoH [Denitromonas sp.]
MTHALSLPIPTTVGSIDQYIQFANRIPLLTEQEEKTYAHRLYDEGDLDAARELVLSHLRLVVAIARGYLGYGLPHADLIQEGNLGLMKAVKRFDPRRGVRLVSFAIHWIKAEIHEYILKNARLVKVATTKAQRKLFFNLRSMKKDRNALSPDDVSVVAAQLGVKPEEVVEMETRLGGQDVPLDSGRDDEDDHFAPIAYLRDPSAEPSELLANAEQAQLQADGLVNAMAALDDRSRHIISARWLTGDDGKAATLHELADEYGVSAERIRQIEAKALKQMRGELAALA